MKSSWLAALKKESGGKEEKMMLPLRRTGVFCATITEVVPWEEEEEEGGEKLEDEEDKELIRLGPDDC